MKAYLVKKEDTKIPDRINYRLYVPDLSERYISFCCRKFTDGSHKFELYRSELVRFKAGDQTEIPEETVKKLQELFRKKWLWNAREDLEKELKELLSQTETNG